MYTFILAINESGEKTKSASYNMSSTTQVVSNVVNQHWSKSHPCSKQSYTILLKWTKLQRKRMDTQLDTLSLMEGLVNWKLNASPTALKSNLSWIQYNGRLVPHHVRITHLTRAITDISEGYTPYPRFVTRNKDIIMEI